MIGLDFETFSTVDLPKHGLHNYVSSLSFRPLIGSVAWRNDSGDIKVIRHDFVFETDAAQRLRFALQDEWIAAHNASFEQAVIQHTKELSECTNYFFTDTAVLARAVGAGGSLAAAAPQLLHGQSKLEEGAHLIKKFSMPQEDGYVYVDNLADWTEEDRKDWETFGVYCDQDAVLSLLLAEKLAGEFPPTERLYWELTEKMNLRGWPVDLDLVEKMQEAHEFNTSMALDEFRSTRDPEGKLNFRSTPQLRQWCLERGVNAKSFDELNVEKLLKRVETELARVAAATHKTAAMGEKVRKLTEVHHMLTTKQELGGSSLSKLERIKEMVSADGRLRGQYLHVGAGQTFRTSGRGVQLQNLKRIGGDAVEMTDYQIMAMSNERLAANIRQVFTASDPKGELIVGDFASVESRGLALLAGAEWKLDAYRQDRDMYKVLASSMLHVPYDSVDKKQRQLGKVGELSCGYGAGPKAVRDFAEKMGTILSENEAAEIVSSWREVNVEVVQLWANLDRALHATLTDRGSLPYVVSVPNTDYKISFRITHTPQSIQDIRSDAKTLMVSFISGKTVLFKRWFQGCFYDGRDICYMKPSELKSGPLWHDRWFKNGQSGRYKLYGGKLAGILTQSLCREIFMRVAFDVENRFSKFANVELIGQFHDELILNWTPVPDHLPSGVPAPMTITKEAAILELERYMSHSQLIPELPMSASVQSSYRYTK